jgi:histone acetyltransferase SAS3
LPTSILNLCRFCQQDEEHDPSADFEEYLACAVCGDNCMLTLKTGLFRLDEADEAAAHRQCARDADALKSEDGESNRIYRLGIY